MEMILAVCLLLVPFPSCFTFLKQNLDKTVKISERGHKKIGKIKIPTQVGI